MSARRIRPGRIRARRLLSKLAAGAAVVLVGGFVVQHAYRLVPAEASPRLRPSVPAADSPRLGRTIFVAGFTPGTYLVTNDFAHFNPTDPLSRKSPDWDVTSGSLFAHDGEGWTGVPDAASPNATSTNGTGSAIFRAITKRHDFEDIAVRFDLQVQGFVTTAKTPARAWDGVHLFLRYRSSQVLYAVSIHRRDGLATIKRKDAASSGAGAASGNGSYHTVGHPVTNPLRQGRWEHVLATIQSNADGSVTIALSVDARLLLRSTDSGVGAAPLTGEGAIGIRGDNVQFAFRHLRVNALG